MPRSPTIYTLPPGTTPQVPDTPISSTMFNAAMNDIEQTFNTAQPVAYGGTGAGTAAGARTNLDVPSNADIANMAIVGDTRRNRVVNGDKLVSQENGQASGTTNGRYISDQNAMFFVSSAGTFTGVNVQTISPAGGYRDRITITVADAALAAGEFLTYTQNLEGSNVRDAKWGTAGAVPIVVRRGFKFPAGTYTVAFHNSGATRSYVTSFTISALEANTDVVRTFSIPGDTSGAWLNVDGVIGWTMDVVIAAGTTFQTTANTWQAGNFLTVTGTTNGIGTAAAVFEFFDEGIRLDPNSTGVYGNYQIGPVDAVYRSERYFFRWVAEIAGVARGSTQLHAPSYWPQEMAKVPIASGVTYTADSGNAGAFAWYTVPAGNPTRRMGLFGNSGSSWNPSGVVSVTGNFSARLS